MRFNNYAEPYVPIKYTFIDDVVSINDGIQMQVWWALGEITDYSVLSFGDFADWSAYDGFTAPSQIFTIPLVKTGETWTLQLRGYDSFGGLATFGPLVQTSNIGDLGASPPELPTFVYAWYVPEPTTFTLLGLGSLALALGRRRI